VTWLPPTSIFKEKVEQTLAWFLITLVQVTALHQNKTMSLVLNMI